MRGLIIILSTLVVLASSVVAYGDLVIVPLDCAGDYTVGQTWTTTFDFGFNFTEISNIYIDWSGSIRAELVVPCEELFAFPIDAQFVADLYDSNTHNFCGWAYVQKGATTYPFPEPFDLQSAFSDDGWSMLLNGKGTIRIGFWGVMRLLYLCTVEDPNGQLNSATLIFEGTLNPLKLSDPDGGESLPAGSTYTINWIDFRSDGNCPVSYLLDYSTNNGQNWIPVDSNSVSNTCSYDWLVPSIDSNQCLIRIVDANDPNVSDTSDAPFTIYKCTLAYDLNHDCFVDFLDFALLASEWLKCGNPFDPDCVQ